MKNSFRILVLIFFVYAVFFALTTLQSLFDRGDLKRASALFFKSPFPGTEKTAIDLMGLALAKKPEEVGCQVALESRERGTVRFTCDGDYQWLVDVVASQIEPVSPKSQELVQLWQKKK